MVANGVREGSVESVGGGGNEITPPGPNSLGRVVPTQRTNGNIVSGIDWSNYSRWDSLVESEDSVRKILVRSTDEGDHIEIERSIPHLLRIWFFIKDFSFLTCMIDQHFTFQDAVGVVFSNLVSDRCGSIMPGEDTAARPH